MSLQHGLLGLLSYEEGTGYDLAKIFQDSLNFFWHAQASQIYRELGRMEEKGWISSRSVIQDGRPNKKIYKLEQEGEQELSRWLETFCFVPDHAHHAMLMRVFFGAEVSPERTLELLQECYGMCMQGMAVMGELAQRNIEVYAKRVARGNTKQRYWQMTLDYGMSQTRAMAEWAKSCMEKIKEEIEEGVEE